MGGASQQIQNEWYKEIIKDYKEECRQLRDAIQNQNIQKQQQPMQQKFMLEQPSNVGTDSLENRALINELLLKKQRIGDLEKENRNLAGEYVKIRNTDEFNSGRPGVVLEQMVKQKNGVTHYISFDKYIFNSICI